MTPERWKQIEEIFLIAADLSPQDRTKYLLRACGEDSDLLHQVEKLLEENEGISIREILQDAADSLSSEVDLNLEGNLLGSYKIIREIGSGGMGRVYLAEDTRLNRRVAIKVLPESFSRDPQNVARFQREAQAASGINHPNIITVHELGSMNNLHFIVTEFIEGKTLREIAREKPLSYSEAIEIGAQIAEALEEAHRAGVIHRDIKSGNIMLDRRGAVKILDFGLSKSFETDALRIADRDSEEFRTLSGMILGTVHYMSPEQAAGKEIDYRTDLFSLGIVLYEMVSGKLPFSANTPLGTLDRIVRSKPEPLTSGAFAVPRDFQRIIYKCLEKAPEHRYQTAKEIADDLRNLKRGIDSGEKIRMSTDRIYPTFSRRSIILLSGLGLLAITIVLVFIIRPFSHSVEPPFSHARFLQLTDSPGMELFPSLSPNGDSFIYSARDDIYLQRIGGKNAINLTADTPELDEQGSFSPDGTKIAFRSERQGGGIFIMGATGESPKRLTDFGYSPAWSPDGEEIVVTTERSPDAIGRFISLSNLYAVNLKTGKKRLVCRHDAQQASWSPNGDRIAFWGWEGGRRDIWTVSSKGGQEVEITKDDYVDWNPVWSPDGTYLYFVSDRGGSMNLWRIRIEETTGKVRSAPEAVTTPALYAQHITFLRNGNRMAYVQFLQDTNIVKFAFDPSQKTIATETPVRITQGSAYAYNPQVSPDGEWIVFDTRGRNQEDLYVVRNDGTNVRQLTDDIFKDRRPRWSPDGTRIAFYSDRSGRYQIHTIKPDGSNIQQLTDDPRGNVLPGWSPDGRMMSLCFFAGPALLLHTDDATAVPEMLPLLDGEEEWFVSYSWSPDGRTIAGWRGRADGPHGGLVLYSLDSQQYRTFTESGFNPFWLNDSKSILFDDQGKIMILDLSSGKVRELFSVQPDDIDGFALSPDNRFIYISVTKKESDIWLMSKE